MDSEALTNETNISMSGTYADAAAVEAPRLPADRIHPTHKDSRLARFVFAQPYQEQFFESHMLGQSLWASLGGRWQKQCLEARLRTRGLNAHSNCVGLPVSVLHALENSWLVNE